MTESSKAEFCFVSAKTMAEARTKKPDQTLCPGYELGHNLNMVMVTGFQVGQNNQLGGTKSVFEWNRKNGKVIYYSAFLKCV